MTKNPRGDPQAEERTGLRARSRQLCECAVPLAPVTRRTCAVSPALLAAMRAPLAARHVELPHARTVSYKCHATHVAAVPPQSCARRLAAAIKLRAKCSRFQIPPPTRAHVSPSSAPNLPRPALLAPLCAGPTTPP